MPKINVLPKSVAELIAAGEVVERPSSVVKELMENSLDAGAASVTVEIRGGGIKYIRVTDNGCGISREDVRTAFISHATSKITSGDDLDSIFTLGFRGEALPSVAAVSKLTMLTKTAEAETGTAFEAEGGEEKLLDDAGCPAGTTVIIKDLFYNTPARMKFLKKDATEGTYVSDIVAKTAISHPGVRFSFIKDGKQVLSTPGNGDLKSCIFAVFGKNVSDGLLECEYEYKSIKVKGYISKPLNNRPNRNLQYCYVNGRFVRIPAAAAALDEAYKNRIMAGKFPMCFLFIDIPPGKIDVNVHPAKTEIRFSEDSSVFEAIYYAAKSSLNKGDTERPEVILKEKKDILQKKTPDTRQLNFSFAPKSSFLSNTDPGRNKTLDNFTSEADNFSQGQAPDPEKSEIKAENGQDADTENIINTFYPEKTHDMGAFCDTSGVFRNLISKEESEKRNRELMEEQRLRVEEIKKQNFAASDLPSVSPETKEEINFRIIGEVFRTYILVESEGKLLIIDKHASHERMIFNRLQEKGFAKDSQMLMFPVSVTLSGKEYAAVTENIDVFAEGGFTVEDFGGGTVIVRDSPVALGKADVASVITEMAGELVKGNMRPVPEKLTWLYHSTACRAAVKAGDEMKEQETEAFVKMLLSDPSVRYCPHGRPVMYELSKHEIEKQFGRV